MYKLSTATRTALKSARFRIDTHFQYFSTNLWTSDVRHVSEMYCGEYATIHVYDAL